MLPPRCFTCGHVLADLELEFEEGIEQIDNNINLTNSEKIDFYYNCDNVNGYIESGLINLKRFSWEKCARETIKVYLR